jgi:hypothetical protein
MNFNLDKQRHQFGVLLILFILVYSSTANEPRRAYKEIEENEIYNQNCKFGEEVSLNDDVREYCETMDEMRGEFTISYFFRCGILLLAAAIAYISFSDDNSEDGG